MSEAISLINLASSFPHSLRSHNTVQIIWADNTVFCFSSAILTWHFVSPCPSINICRINIWLDIVTNIEA